MTFDRARGPARGARELLAAAFAAALLVLAFGLPVLAGQPPGPTKLLEPSVAPRTADTATPVTFTVIYRNAHDLPPEYVRVVVGGVTWPMSGAGSDWKAGVVFRVTKLLPVGTHAVRFEARDAEKFPDNQDAGTVAIGQGPAPTSTPPPDPTPLPPDPTDPPPAPTPTPTPPPDGGSGGTGGGGTGTGGTGTGSSGGADPDGGSDPDGTGGTGGSGGEVPDPTTGGTTGGTGGGSTSGGSTSGGSGATDTSTGIGAGDDWATSSTNGGSGATDTSTGIGAGDDWATSSTNGGTGWSGNGAVNGPTGPGGGPILGVGEPGGVGEPNANGTASTPRGQGGSGGGLNPGAWLRDTLGIGMATAGLTGNGGLPTLPTVVTSTILVASWMAFVLFNKRRRDEEPPAPEGMLQAAAAMGIGMGAVLAPVPVDPEALMPRWRRPSLIEARKTDPIRAPAPQRPRQMFAQGMYDTGTTLERRAVRYAVIPLLDRPDEIQAMRIGELAAGDEVEVQQRSGAYCHVLCPDGREGWIHRTTLGDIVATRTTGGRTIEPDAAPEADNALAALLAARGLR